MVGTPLVLKVDPFRSHSAAISQAVSHQKEADQREVNRKEVNQRETDQSEADRVNQIPRALHGTHRE